MRVRRCLYSFGLGGSEKISLGELEQKTMNVVNDVNDENRKSLGGQCRRSLKVRMYGYSPLTNRTSLIPGSCFIPATK